jgi:hypothetical protein
LEPHPANAVAVIVSKASAMQIPLNFLAIPMVYPPINYEAVLSPPLSKL